MSVVNGAGIGIGSNYIVNTYSGRKELLKQAGVGNAFTRLFIAAGKGRSGIKGAMEKLSDKNFSLRNAAEGAELARRTPERREQKILTKLWNEKKAQMDIGKFGERDGVGRGDTKNVSNANTDMDKDRVENSGTKTHSASAATETARAQGHINMSELQSKLKKTE
jgi:hypothetical protein